MAKMRFILASAFLSLALGAPSHALSPEEASKLLSSADLHPDPNKTIQDNLPGLKSRSEQAFSTVYQKLMFSYNEQRFPTDENKQLLSRELIKFYESSGSPKERIVEALAKYGDNQYAKPFILKVLAGSNGGERDSALRMLGAPGGVSGPELYDKVKELANKGQIKSEGRTTMLARVDKKRAFAEIIADLKTTKDKEHFIYSAWALQDYYRDPDNYRYIVPRIKEFGIASDGRVMNKSFRGGSGIGWMNADLFGQYIEKAPKARAKEAFDIMAHEGQLCTPANLPLLFRMLKDDDAEVRLWAAQGLYKTAEYGGDAAPIKTNLKTAISVEKAAATKAAMETALKSTERFETAWKKVVESQKR